MGRREQYGLAVGALGPACGWLSGLSLRASGMMRVQAELVSPQRRVALAGALRTPGRRNMLECMCRGGPITQGAAAADCELRQGHASRGLATLVQAGLVTVRTPGPPRRYAAVPEVLESVVRWLRVAWVTAAEVEADWRKREVEAAAMRRAAASA